jgi:hypothetical protein
VEQLEPRILLAGRPVPLVPPPAGLVALHVAADVGRSAAPVRTGMVLAVPGLPGQTVRARFTWTGSDAAFHNEFGLFRVDDRSGRVGRLRPGQPGYAAAALSRGRAKVILASGEAAGATRALDLPSGRFFGLYLVQDGTTAAFRAGNPKNRLLLRPVVVFCFAKANPDGRSHMRWLSGNVFTWDDGGDSAHDFGDLTARVDFGRPRGKPAVSPTGITTETGPQERTAGTLTTACSFPHGPGDWAVAQTGGSAGGRGTVSLDACSATLREGDSFTVTLAHTFTVPQQPSELAFDLGGPTFDSSGGHTIKDAFEVVLVDGNARPLVHTFTSGRDAFFNVSAGQTPALGAGTSFDGHTVRANLAGLPPGATATLLFRLVNNDRDTHTDVHLENLQIQATNQAPPGGVTPALAAARSTRPIDFAALADVSASFTPDYARTSFDAATQVLHAELAVRDTGQYQADAPLVVEVAHLTDPTVHVQNADGTAPDGNPYFDFSGLVGGRTIAPGAATGARALDFFNPGGGAVHLRSRRAGAAEPAAGVHHAAEHRGHPGRALCLPGGCHRPGRRPAALRAAHRAGGHGGGRGHGQGDVGPATGRPGDARGGPARGRRPGRLGGAGLYRERGRGAAEPAAGVHLDADGRCQRQHAVQLPGDRPRPRRGRDVDVLRRDRAAGAEGRCPERPGHLETHGGPAGHQQRHAAGG